jgi:hypothetical protein
MMIELKQEQPAPIPNEMLMRVIQINESIVRQNALIIQALTFAPMIVKKENTYD